MAEELRNIFNQHFMTDLCKRLQEAYPSFNQDQFLEFIYVKEWDELALKQRVRHISTCFYQTIPKNYSEALRILKTVAPHFQGSLGGIIFPDYIEVYGLDDWNESINGLEYFTQYSTSEFAVRPFVLKDQEKMMKQFSTWSQHENEHVRRLASEGSRPRLPWGIVLKSLKKDPSDIFPILEQLKNDPSLYVRKSVANNINDISKDHPERVLDLAKKWLGQNERTDWIVKKGLRTLLKKGIPEALELFGLGRNEQIKANDLHVTDQVAIGESLTFSFTIKSNDKEPHKIRIEYVIDFVKANGKHSAKQFKISETTIVPGEEKQYTKVHSFKDLSTRKHYSGKHLLSIMINGEVKTKVDFEVVNNQ